MAFHMPWGACPMEGALMDTASQAQLLALLLREALDMP